MENGALAGAVFRARCGDTRKNTIDFHPAGCVSTLLTALRKPWAGIHDA
jgi:hypothetical protein